MERELERWLALQNSCDIKNIKEIYKSKIGIDFLLVWSLYENKCFDFRITPNEFEIFSINNIELSDSLEEEISHFYKRYKDKGNKFHALNLSTFNKKKIIRILDNFDKETQANKILFLLHVIHRFRNNMFHGNKLMSTWFSEYEKEINYCISTMQKLVENKTGKKITELSNEEEKPC